MSDQEYSFKHHCQQFSSCHWTACHYCITVCKPRLSLIGPAFKVQVWKSRQRQPWEGIQMDKGDSQPKAAAHLETVDSEKCCCSSPCCPDCEEVKSYVFVSGT